MSEIQSPTDDCAHKGGGPLPFERTVRRLRSGKAGIPLHFRASTCSRAYTKRVYKNNARAAGARTKATHSVYVTLARTKISDACGLTLF